jgi:prepilin-type N-terminal cleavage/methylation domain-containing protein
MKRVRQIHGFTLLEMLTALAIIALMIGLLIPAIGMIQKTAQTVKQKAQFHAIEVSLEAFRTDVGDYPPSSYTRDSVSFPISRGTDGYCGAQKLAEAIVGMDGFGFHSSSQWRSDGRQDINGDYVGDVPLYYGATGFDSFTPAQRDTNLKARKGPYLELEKANAVKLNSLYLPGHEIFSSLAGNTFVLCDMFGQAKNLATGRRTGMPILYFRADTSKTSFLPDPLTFFPWSTGTTMGAIYNVNENYSFFRYGISNHPMMNDLSLFYQRIKNPNFPGTVVNGFRDARPYRAQTFILLSAGPDGLYGTPDDVYNIDENDK